MKKLLKLSLLLCISLSLFSCKGMFGGDKEDDLKNGNTTRQVLKFSPSGAKALALVDNGGVTGNVGARNATTEGMIQKILEDGSLESYITVPGGVSLAPISYIAQSPTEDANEVYVVFEYSTWYGYNDPDTDKWVDGQIGQLLCVFEDGTYDDILKTEDGEWKGLYGYSKDSIAFDNQGGMYYLVSEGSGNTNTNMIYKYDKTTASSIQLTSAVNNTYYNKFQVSNDGKWIFATANRWNNDSNTSFLRAIPVDNPNSPINLFYDSTNSRYLRDWIYDNDTRTIYYIVDGTLYSNKEEDGTFTPEKETVLFSCDSSNWFSYSDEHSFLKWSNSSSVYDYKALSYVYTSASSYNQTECWLRDPMTPEQNVDFDEVINYLSYKPYESFKTIDSKYKDGSNYKPITEFYDIRFDEFANELGFEMLASATAGLKNKEALAAIDKNGLNSLFANLLESTRYARSGAGYVEMFDHNFFADVLYEKDSDKKINPDLFNHHSKNTACFSSTGISRYDMFDWCNSSCYTWNDSCVKTETKNGTSVTVVDAQKVLEVMSKYCNTTAENITFKLTAFKDIPGYTGLYTDKEDAEAIEFLDTPARISLMTQYMDSNWDGNNGNGKFLYLTCFQKGTDTPAYSWRDSQGETIYWWNIYNLTTSYKNSLYGYYNNGSDKGLIEIIDAEGKVNGTYVTVMQPYQIVSTLVSENGFYFQNALLNTSGKETGSHQIQYYDVEKGNVTNLFDKLANKDGIEVTSFSVGGDEVYFTGAVGMTLTTGKINAETKEYTELSSGTKLSQIMAVK